MPKASLRDQVDSLNKKLKKDSRARLEVLAAVSKALRDNDIKISTQLLGNLHFTIGSELPKGERALSIDPPTPTGPSVDPK